MEHPDDARLLDLVARLTLDEKVRVLTGRDSWSLHPLPSIGLRSLVVSDGPVGVRGDVWDERSPSANFPSPTALASTWSRGAVRRVGRGLGSEARRKSIDVVLAPTINLHRSPYGGRHFEMFSEDPILTSELAGEYVRGVQEYGVGATLKHYVANEFETERFTVDIRVDDRTLRELYLLAFEGPVVEAGAWLVMSSYNSIQGVTASENRLLTTPLNDEWGFDGVVISDWTAVRSLESARQAQDLAMPGPTSAWSAELVDAVRAGFVDEADVDRKVVRILRLAARVGALDGVAPAVQTLPSPADVRAIARDVAVEGTVLLTNDGILPLAGSPTIALIGEGAVVARTQGGGSATVIPDVVVSPAEGLRARFGDGNVGWARGAIVDRRPSPIPLDRFTNASGGPGMTVSYLAGEGVVLGTEDRDASTFVSFEGESLLTRSAAVEASFSFTPDGTGDTPFAVIGLCDYEVDVDGTRVASGEIRLAPGDDFATAVLTPPFATVTLPIAADGSRVTVRFRPVAGGVPDAAAFGVGLPAPDLDADELIAQAARLAAAQDVAVVIVSTSAEVESEGFDRDSLALPGRQDDLVRAVAAANPRTVVVVNAGAPVLLPWRDEVAATLAVWFPGQEFGGALADILSGDAEPGGRLPTTWPDSEGSVPVRDVTPVDGRLEYTEGLNIGYRAWLAAEAAPAFPFGYGLGYTTWRIASIDAPATEVRVGEDLPVSATVLNTGARDGKAVVQFYLERASASEIERPQRWLVGFETTTLSAGESRQVSTVVPWRRLAHWADGWHVEPGEYRLVAGLDVADRGESVVIRVA